MKTYVFPVVLYGLECVNWASISPKKTETFQNYMMRFMANHKLSEHLKIKELQVMKLTPITSIIKTGF